MIAGQNAPRPVASLSAVPASIPDVESEINRLHNAVERANHLFGELAQRLHSVRREETAEAKAMDPNVPAATKLGGQIRAATDRVDQLSDNLAYHLRTVELTS